MAQAWQQFLESWWQGLLGDPDKLRDLARVLSEAGLGSEERSGADDEDLSRVVQALELLEQRQKSLEEQVRSLADNFAAVVTFLEQAHDAKNLGGDEETIDSSAQEIQGEAGDDDK